MRRRQVLVAAPAAITSLTLTNHSYAALPLFGWFARVAAGLLERQAASTVARGAVAAAARSTSGQALRSAATPAIVAMRASSAARVLRNLTALSISTIAVDEVLAQVQQTPDDSILRWTLAYYAVLTQSDADAAMGMWVDPPDESHFNHLKYGISRYSVTELTQTTHSQIVASVAAQNRGESEKYYRLAIDWTPTDHGYRISNLTSA